MRARSMLGALPVVALVAWLSCGDDAGGNLELLQDPCVRDVISFSDDVPDGQECFNIGYADCPGFASDCIHYCAFDVCQSAPCTSDGDCEGLLGLEGECSDYVVSDTSYGRWCRVSDCPKGMLGCPCRDGGCYVDPYGSGEMTCTEAGTCESACPWECRSGESVCCGGAYCGGDCVGSPCC